MTTSYNQTVQIYAPLMPLEPVLFDSYLYSVVLTHKDQQDFRANSHGDNVNVFIVSALCETDVLPAVLSWYSGMSESSIPIDRYDVEISLITPIPVKFTGILSAVYRW